MAVDPRQGTFPTGATYRRPGTAAPRPLLTFGGPPTPRVPPRSPLSFGGTSTEVGPLASFSNFLGWNMGETVAAKPASDPRRGTFPTGAVVQPKTDGSAAKLNELSARAGDLFQRMGLGRNPDQPAVQPAFWNNKPAQKPRFELSPVIILGALGIAGYLMIRGR